MPVPHRNDRGVSRRRVLELAASGVLLAAFPASARTWAAPRRLAFQHTHTGETLDCIYWDRGGYLPDALAGIDRLLRDHRTDEVAPIDRSLLDRLHGLRAALGTDAPFQVISGYRSPETNRMLAAKRGGVARRSFHTRGMAIDVRLAGTDVATLHRAALAQRGGGTGFYPASGFVHVDVGPVRSWS